MNINDIYISYRPHYIYQGGPFLFHRKIYWHHMEI